VVMRETLDEGLAELFGGTTGPARTPTPAVAAQPAAGSEPEIRTLIEEARRRYQAAVQAQREIDWARYGEEMRRLGEALEQMGSAEAD
jgi:uncharacterized protein